jgi:hypothetical protein
MPITAALAELNDGELCALIKVSNSVPQIVPGLLAWIGHACNWELNRRACVDFPLQTPDAVIPPDEDAASVAAMMTLRVRFDEGAGGDACAVVALFDAMIRALTGGERRHWQIDIRHRQHTWTNTISAPIACHRAAVRVFKFHLRNVYFVVLQPKKQETGDTYEQATGMEDLQTGRLAKADGRHSRNSQRSSRRGKNTRCTSVLAITKRGFVPMRRAATGRSQALASTRALTRVTSGA